MPSALYQYHEFDTEGHSIANLTNNTFWLTSPDRFNDPYDCAFTVMINELRNSFMRSSIDSVLSKIDFPIVLEQEKIEEIEQSENVAHELSMYLTSKSAKLTNEMATAFTNAFSSVLDKRFAEMVTRLQSRIKKGMLISCFSETNSSILMWSHYANKHSGFCVEYDFKQTPINNVLTRLLFPVVYSQILVDATKYLHPLFSIGEGNLYYGILAAITKSVEWQYEKEWRLVIPFGFLDAEQGFKVPRVKAVYLGSRSNVDRASEMKALCRKMDIKLFRAEIDKLSFFLRFNDYP
jgi:hypothetical protein